MELLFLALHIPIYSEYVSALQMTALNNVCIGAHKHIKKKIWENNNNCQGIFGSPGHL